MNRISLATNGEERGPFSRAQIDAMYLSGTITSDTFYWHEGMTEWLPIESLMESETTARMTVYPAEDRNEEVRLVTTPSKLSSAVEPSRYNLADDTFSGSMVSIVKLAVRAIQSLNWKVEYVNENIGTVSFEAGSGSVTAYDYSCSLNIEEIGPNTFRVTSTGKLKVRGNTVFALDGGSGKQKAQKAVDRMKELALDGDKLKEFKEDQAASSRPKRIAIAVIIVIGLIIIICSIVAG